jgi:predicted Zn-dependent protease
MKARLVWFLVTGLTAAALVSSQIWPVDAPASGAPLLYFIADTEHELTRLPVAFTRLSDADEIKAGDQIAAMYQRFLGASPQGQPESEIRYVADYLERFGAHLAPHAHRKLPYKFHYVPSMYFINAFALPGGHVFVGAGLMDLMETADELASVLGHEIEHIDHYHCAERLQIEMALRRLPLGGLIGLPVEIFAAGYSKDQELEADREGTRLAVDAGYSPQGSLRVFESFQRLYEKYMRQRAKPPANPQEEMARVAVDVLAGYFRSHPLTSERLGQIHRMIRDEHWDSLTRRTQPLPVQFIFVTQRARIALRSGHYDEAIKLAQKAVELKPEYAGALQVLARAQFAQADFDQAAATWRKLLNLYPTEAESAREYPIALAAAGDRAKAIEEFTGFLAAWKQPDAKALARARLELAGLKLLAGDEPPAAAALAELRRNPGPESAGSLARLGHWYYLAAKYDQAESSLSDAVEQLPQDRRFQVQLAWVLVEQRKFASAIERFQGWEEGGPIGWAVASWQAQNRDLAVEQFTRAVTLQPSWLNPRWVRALYGPVAAQSIVELQAERMKREAAKKQNPSQTRGQK